MNLEWKRDVDQQLRELFQRTKNLDVRGRGGGSATGSGSGSSDNYHHEAASKAGLTDPTTVPAGAFGRVYDVAGTDPDDGKGYVLNTARTAWVCFTHWG